MRAEHYINDFRSYKQQMRFPLKFIACFFSQQCSLVSMQLYLAKVHVFDTWEAFSARDGFSCVS